MENIGELVLYKNNQFIAFNKPSGIPVQEDKSGDKPLLSLGEIYCKHTLFLSQRLDRPASGVCIFAKKKEGQHYFGQLLEKKAVAKYYLAVVKTAPKEEKGKLVHFLKRDGKNKKGRVGKEGEEGFKEAILDYVVLGKSDHYTLVAIKLETGRFHQIRVQLSAIGSPIKGDVKYGARRGNKDRSVHLHAYRIEFKHPISGQKEKISAPLPEGPVWAHFMPLVGAVDWDKLFWNEK